jgi:hypothetical protein
MDPLPNAQLTPSAQEHPPRTSPSEIELSRRQLEASWSQLRREQQEWRERRQQEEAELQARGARLEQRESAVRQASAELEAKYRHDEAARQTLAREFDGLDRRIRNYRDRLATLRAEAARLEATVSLGSMTPALPGPSPSVATACPAQPEYQGDLPALFGKVAEDLMDQHRQITEHWQAARAIRRAWAREWDAALAELARRETDLHRREEGVRPREQALFLAEQALQRHAGDLARQQRQLECWEARLAQQQSVFRCGQGQLVEVVKARVGAARERFQAATRLLEQWGGERRLESERYRHMLAAGEAARQDHDRLREKFRQRLAALGGRWRRLLERELIVREAEQCLIAQQPDPVSLEKELERKRRHWERLAHRPVLRLRSHQRRVERQARELEGLHFQLAEGRRLVEEQKAECAQLQLGLEAQLARLNAERIDWKHELEAGRAERAKLQQHVADLQRQLERLASYLVDPNRPDPPLAAAA